jgi:hypothetical protein
MDEAARAELAALKRSAFEAEEHLANLLKMRKVSRPKLRRAGDTEDEFQSILRRFMSRDEEHRAATRAATGGSALPVDFRDSA